MRNDYKKMLFIVFIALIMIILADFQIAFMNNFNWKFNIFLILILFLVLNKYFYSAFFLGWLGGLLTDTVNFSIFGINSLIFLSLTASLVVFKEKALIIAKTEEILIISTISIFFYHFFEWLINSVLISGQEKLSFYFLNSDIVAEMLFTVILLLIIFYFTEKFYLISDV